VRKTILFYARGIHQPAVRRKQVAGRMMTRLIIGGYLAAVLTLHGQVITQQPVSAIGIVGGQVVLTVVATGTNLTYQWFKDGQPVQMATGPQLTLLNLRLGDAGCYTVAVSSPDGQVPVMSDAAGVQVREANAFAEGLIACFTFDHLGWPDGFTTLNSATGGSNGVVKGSVPDWPPGQVRDALLFNGTNNYVLLPDYAKPSQAMTVAGWVLSSGNQWGPILNNWVPGGSPGSNGQFLVEVVLNGGVPTLRAQVGVGPDTILAASPVAGTLNTWHHFAMSANGTALSIYWDGALMGSMDYLGSINATPFSWLSIGANLTATPGAANPPSLTGIPWSGAMDDIVLWGRSLSAAEIQLIYTAGLSGSGVSEIRSGFAPNVTIATSATNGQVHIFWPTSAGRTYRVEGRTDFGPQSQWAPVSVELPGTGEPMDFNSGGAPGGGFFRVRSAEPKSLRVPQDFQSIQQAIGSLADGGTIDIGPGTFPGPIVINKRVTLRGSADTNAPTVLLASDPAQPVIYFGDGGQGVLSYLTFDGGAAGIAAGLSNSCWRADVTGDHLTISNATRGIYGSFGELRLNDVDISASQKYGLSILDARALVLRKMGLRNNGNIGMVLFNDKAKPKGDIALVIGFSEVHDNAGGGIYILGHAAPVLINRCNVHNNGIVGIIFDGANGTVLQSLINNNYPNPLNGLWGDGFLVLSGAAELSRCTIGANARAGVTIVGCGDARGPGIGTLADNDILGNLTAIDLEKYPDCTMPLFTSAQVYDAGGNDCGDPAGCKAESSSLEPPPTPPER
jgi:hypothetical protein